MKSLDAALSVANLVRMANENYKLMDGTTEPVKRIMESHDIVYAVWQDFARPNDAGHLIVKGVPTLVAVVAERKTITASVTAIKCACIEQAMALRQVYGDVRRAH